ncbi:MAG: hypothetical protein BroJett014_12220 [Planctomycetota bacterium]|nr:hypothetical protein [Planctomycetota bacterium]GIK52249.1 MAG: hypothetical protein BroJett014_12220 [Planctomycetota bacterium]
MATGQPTLRHAALVELLDRYVQADQREQAGHTAIPGQTPADLRKQIEAVYWQDVCVVAESLVREDMPKEFEISEQDRDFISFGICEHPLLGAAKILVSPWSEVRAEPDQPLYFLHDAVRAAYRDALRLETLAKLRQKLDAVNGELEEWPDANLECIKYRDRLVATALGNSPQAQHLLRQFSELDERIEDFKVMEHRNQSEGWQSGEERKQWLAVKQYMDQRQTEINRVLEPLSRKARGIKEELARIDSTFSETTREIRKLEAELADMRAAQERDVEGTRMDTRNRRQLEFIEESLSRAREREAQCRARDKELRDANAECLNADSIAAAGDAVTATVDHLLELRNERRLLEAQIRDEETTAHQTTPVDVRHALVHELGNVRGLMRLCAKHARVTECALPLVAGARSVDPESLLQALREIEEFDPNLFNNAGVKRFGKPTLLLAPGIGDGVFDSDRNRFVIPQYTLKTPLESVANAAVLYRLDADAAYNDRRLFRGYQGEIREHRGQISNLKLRMSLIRDYLCWVTREARGEQALERDVRAWFEQHVAPRKDDPIVPLEYRALPPRQLKARLDEIERGQPSAERSFRSGVLRWLLDPQNEAALKQQVLPAFEDAMHRAPENMVYVYGAATLYRKARLFQQAIECFNRYASQARQSWWTCKAVELCASCR